MGVPCQLVVICGRNEALRSRLRSHLWPGAVPLVLGFTSDVDVYMGAGACMSDSQPLRVAETVRSWLTHPQRLQDMSRCARALARPRATLQIARRLGRFLHLEPFGKHSCTGKDSGVDPSCRC